MDGGSDNFFTLRGTQSYKTYRLLTPNPVTLLFYKIVLSKIVSTFNFFYEICGKRVLKHTAAGGKVMLLHESRV